MPVGRMNRRELSASKKAPWNRHFLHPNCQTPVEFDTLDSSFVRASFDHFVGAAQQRRREGDAKHFGGLEVEDQLELRRLLDGKSAGFAPLRMFPV